MNNEFGRYIRNLFRTKPRLVASIVVSAIIASALFVRFYNPSYRAKITLIVRDEQQSPSKQTLSVFLGGLNALQRDSFILSLEPLLYSEQVFQYLRSNLQDRGIWNEEFPDEEPSELKQSIKNFLFGEEYVSAQQYIDRQYESYKRRCAFETSLDAGTFSITFQSKNPKIALEAVQLLAEALIKYQLQLENQQLIDVVTFLERKEEDIATKWSQVSQAIVEKMAKEQLPFNEELLVRQLQTVSDLKKDALLKRIEQQGLKSSLASLDSSISGFGEQTKGDKQNYAEAAKALAANITRLESQNLLLDKPNPALTAQIETLRNQLKSYLSPTTLNQESLAQLRLHLETQRSQLAATLANNESALTYLDRELAKLEKKVEVILSKEIGMSKLLLEKEIMLNVLQFVSEAKVTSQMSSETKVSKMAIINDAALVTHALSSSKSRILLLMTGILAIFTYIVFCLIDYSKGVIYNKAQLKELHDTVQLGLMPAIDYTNTLKHPLTDPWVANTISVIQRRYLSGEGSKRIFITSAHEGDGKSTFAMLLASTLADRGVKTVLLDADIYGKTRVSDQIEQALQRSGGEPISRSQLTSIKPNLSAIRLTRDNIQSFLELDLASRVTIVDCPPSDFLGEFTFDRNDVIVMCTKEAKTTIDEIEAIRATVLDLSRSAPRFSILLTHVRLPENLNKKNYGNYIAAS